MFVFSGFQLPFRPYGMSAAQTENVVQFDEVFFRMVNLCVNRFEWKGLPESCNERALEITLFFYGKALFAKDPDFGYINVPFLTDGTPNMYYEYTKRRGFSFDYNRSFDETDSVIVRNTPMMTPTFLTAEIYANQIADVQRTIQVHTNTLKRPFLMRADEREKTSIVNVFKKVLDNEPLIMGTKFADNDNFNVLDLKLECYLPELWESLGSWWSAFYTALGINSTPYEKKERLITEEVTSNDEVNDLNLNSMLESRRRAAEEANELFGWNLSVDVRETPEFVSRETLEGGREDYVLGVQ